MCYSAQILADYRRYVRMFGRLVEGSSGAKVPKAMDASFLDSLTDDSQDIRRLVEQYNAARLTNLEQELFKQRKRLADAERTLQTKTTKAATESRRIAAGKIDATLRRLEDTTRKELEPRDSRSSTLCWSTPFSSTDHLW
jgi:hypothetical protein